MSEMSTDPAGESAVSPIVVKLPEAFNESFAGGQSARGTTSWNTLFSAQLSAGVVRCPPGGRLALHRHAQAELYHILSGTGRVEIDDNVHHVGEGMTLYTPEGVEHGVRNNTDVDSKWLYVFPGKFEDVHYRFTLEDQQPDIERPS